MRHHKLRKDMDEYLSRRYHPKDQKKRWENPLKRFTRHLSVNTHQVEELAEVNGSVTVIHGEPNFFQKLYAWFKSFFRNP